MAQARFGWRWLLNDRHHIDELQSLRGVAALTVVVSHMTPVYVLPRGARIAIDSVFNAHASIIVFFVLSGYVLTGSLLRRGLSWTSIKGFYLGRLFRLFPALWAASMISALFLLWRPTQTIHPAPSFWFGLFLHPLPSAAKLGLAALAFDTSLIMPVWSIFIELMGSAIMPLVVILMSARARIFEWVLFGMGVASFLLAHAPHRLNSLAYMFDFALGAWLASGNGKRLAGNSLSRLFGAAFTLIFFRFLWFSIRNGHPMPLYGYDDPLPMLVEGIAAFFLIGSLASEHGRIRLLRSRWAVWLGNVSYSLYLIHFPVTILVAKFLGRAFSSTTSATTATAVLMPIALAISFGLAFLLYRLVEIPSIALGKKVSKRFMLSGAPVKVA
jgi:peptidoglycan/LPS O-acetylase OafA/YrhL